MAELRPWFTQKIAPGKWAVMEGVGRPYQIALFKTERDADRMVRAARYRIVPAIMKAFD